MLGAQIEESFKLKKIFKKERKKNRRNQSLFQKPVKTSGIVPLLYMVIGTCSYKRSSEMITMAVVHVSNPNVNLYPPAKKVLPL